jgi:hypothetical protein
VKKPNKNGHSTKMDEQWEFWGREVKNKDALAD